LFVHQCANISWKYVQRDVATAAEASGYLTSLEALPLQRTPKFDLDEALTLATAVLGGKFLMNGILPRKWHDLLRVWDVSQAVADRTYEELRTHYAGPGRFYHTLDHVENVLQTVECLGSHVRNLNAVKLAAWLHDVIYDSRASDNEERSAAYAKRLCAELSIPEGCWVAALIEKTKTHDAGEDADAQVLIDADLAILGASESVYRVYAEQIRQEYAWVPDSKYRTGRQRILELFLTRPRIYHFLSHLEVAAHRNIASEIVRLTVP
jgi:predicted metal-dependent HD superfamily phosphohydrolase